MTKPAATGIGLRLLSTLEVVLALPIGILAILYANHLFPPINLPYAALELILILSTIGAAFFTGVFLVSGAPKRGYFLGFGYFETAIVYAALLSPLYPGFIH